MNFQSEEVCDKDVYDLSNDDLRLLIPKIGPRSRFREFLKQKKK